MKKQIVLCLLVSTCCVFYAAIPKAALGQTPSLAQQVFDKHRATFAREDIQAVLPNLLVELKDPEIQKRLTPALIDAVVANPDLLGAIIPDIDPTLITLLKEDAELKAVLSDPLVQTLMQDPVAIDELGVLLETSEPPDPTEPPDVGDGAVPDLVVTSERIGDGTLLPSENFTLSAIVTNSGNAESTSTTLRYYRSVDQTISTTDTLIGTDSIAVLNANGTSDQDITIIAPTTPGTYYYGACVDSLTNESDPSNNCSDAISIVVAAGAPDLVVESVEIVPPTFLVPEQEFRLYGTLKNQGTGESTKTTLRYYHSANDIISPKDTQIGRGTRHPLAVNATIRKYLTVVAPTTPGTYYYGICVDSVVNESSTENNCTMITVKVISADINGDGSVDIQDLVLVAQNYKKTAPNSADVNGDGIVDVEDFILVAGVLDTSDAAPALQPYLLVEGFTAADVQLWLSQVQHLDLTDARSLRGIHFLEQLLGSLNPKETLLLPNYPNPFNPETWIPYQLASPAAVTITIYAANGQAVRILEVGHQPAGTYQSRSRAAYWDGRNDLGEPVASGLYFYTFSADDFTATRRMLIRK